MIQRIMQISFPMRIPENEWLTIGNTNNLLKRILRCLDNEFPLTSIVDINATLEKIVDG